MALFILAMAENRLATLIKAGSDVGNGIADTAITFANQVSAWKAPVRTFRIAETLTRDGAPVPLTEHNTSQEAKAPLGAREGECLYDTNSLFCYDGARSGRKVAMVLWKFALNPKPGDFGQGRLMAGATMSAGDIYWEIIIPPDPTSALRSFGSWSGSSETRKLLKH